MVKVYGPAGKEEQDAAGQDTIPSSRQVQPADLTLWSVHRLVPTSSRRLRSHSVCPLIWLSTPGEAERYQRNGSESF